MALFLNLLHWSFMKFLNVLSLEAEISKQTFFYNVGPPRSFLTTFYSLYFNQQVHIYANPVNLGGFVC